MTLITTKLDPFDDRFQEIEARHRAEEQRVNAETDWLAVFPEAKNYIVERAVELGKQLAEKKNSLQLCSKELAQAEDNSERQTPLIIVQALIESEIGHLAKQLHILTQTVHKHLSQQSISKSDVEISLFNLSEIEEARAFPLVDLFERDGRVLKRSGMNFMTHCPFHDERTPSCHIYMSENQYHCFGCEEHGNSIDYMMKLHNMTFRDAVGYLLGRVL
jgi:hypothetical protein